MLLRDANTVTRMFRRWLGRRRRCRIHDVTTPAKIARLEVATGIDPGAEAAMWERVTLARPGDVIEWFYDPDLIDCGRQWCRRRRGLA